MGPTLEETPHIVLREHLERMGVREREQADRDGYARRPEDPREAVVWGKVAAWPEE